MDVRIRSAGVDDVPSLAATHLATVTRAYAALFPSWAPPPNYDGLVQDWLSTMGDESARAFIAEHDGRAVGTVAMRREPGSDNAQLRRLHVLPDHWGQASEALSSGGPPETIESTGITPTLD